MSENEDQDRIRRERLEEIDSRVQRGKLLSFLGNSLCLMLIGAFIYFIFVGDSNIVSRILSGASKKAPEHAVPAQASRAVETSQPRIDKVETPAKGLYVVPFASRDNNIKYLQISINGLPFEAMLDTGASSIAVTRETVERLGVTRFDGRVMSHTANGKAYGYLFKCASVRLGQVEVKDVECKYMPNLNMNLLGRAFLKNFNLSINELEKTLTLVPISEKVIATKDGFKIVSGDGWAEVDGHKYVLQNGKLVRTK